MFYNIILKYKIIERIFIFIVNVIMIFLITII